ncbi:hypothetical protein [uncultured Tyzzerella sp.]|uniref:hypothetical protein n=1 Tax=uncultured Tyzzerella sp. TaxID=2321398 RepID=UPI0029433F04|nr:hypothetical protein [uncultured Tyzzerella sp.]
METITLKFVNMLINNNTIKKEDAEIYIYGFKEMIFITLIFNKINLSAYICISLLCNGVMLMLGKINNLIIYKHSK